MGQYAHRFGTPLMQVHRGDLHEMLYKRARDLGVVFRLGSKIVDYDTERPSIRLESGENVHADLVVAADGALFIMVVQTPLLILHPGINSVARHRMREGAHDLEIAEDLALDSNRCMILTKKVLDDPETSWVLDVPGQNLWFVNAPLYHSVVNDASRKYRLT